MPDYMKLSTVRCIIYIQNKYNFETNYCYEELKLVFLNCSLKDSWTHSDEHQQVNLPFDGRKTFL